MLILRRFSIIIGIVLVGMISVTLPALADNGWGNTICEQTPVPACDLGAGSGGERPRGGPGPGERGARRPDAGSPRDERTLGDGIVGGDANLADCAYVRSDYQPPASGVVTIGHTRPPAVGGTASVVPVVFTRPATGSGAVVAHRAAQPAQGPPGAWYVWQCSSEGVADGFYRVPVWIPFSGPAVGAPSPAAVAEMARRQLRLPVPGIAVNPAGVQLVTVPTWLWLSGGWTSMSATASVPGVSVTAVATPMWVSWSMGDGSTVTCTGAGTPYRAGSDPESASPDCGHTYRTSSARQAGEVFPVSATVHWNITWSGAGQAGVFPDMITTGATAVRVAEAQALNDNGGG